jgi:gluconolactonase
MVETIRDGFGFINGILWVREGRASHLLVSDIPANIVHKWTPTGGITPFLERPDWTTVTEARPANVRFGANGMVMDREGRIVYAAEADRAVVRLERDGRRTILADRYEGKRLNSPNDLVFRSDGSLYFTDRAVAVDSARDSEELPYQSAFSEGRPAAPVAAGPRQTQRHRIVAG